MKRIDIRWGLLVGLMLLAPVRAFAVDGYYLGVQGGFVGAGATTYQSGLGAGLDLGAQVNGVLDLVLRAQFSSHAGTPSFVLTNETISADFHLMNMADIDIAVGTGPGLYQFSSATRFGLHGEIHTDVLVGGNWRAGLGWRYHVLLDPAAGEGNFWSVMVRIGFTWEKQQQ